MNGTPDAAKPPDAAWQPLTFGGVASFAGARLGRLLAVEFVFALIASGVVVWFTHRAYCPVILDAVQKMPESARIAAGMLEGVPDAVTAESRFLSIAVASSAGKDAGQGADVQVRLRPTDICVVSINWPAWGLDFDYDKAAGANLGRSVLEPLWSAWQPVILVGLGAAVVIALLMAWAIIAAMYIAPAKLVALFAERNLSIREGWRLSSAALLPGALVMTGAIILYALGATDLVGLAFFFVVHLVIGWIYIVGGAIKVKSRAKENPNVNPFTAA